MKLHTIYNKVKGTSLVAATALATVGGFTACSDFLEIKPQNEIIFEDFWNEKTDVDAIVAGCYSALQSDPVMRRMMIWGEFRSDNITAGLNIDKDLNLDNIFKENLTANNGYTAWGDFYNIINRCNTVIKYAPDVAQRDPSYSQSELAATIAEVSAIRDLCWFYLIRTFRDVPFSNEAFTDDDQVMDLPATPFDQVLDFLISDLEQQQGAAIYRYPETSPLYQTGRVTRTFIHAMLCELYLWKKDYANCVRYADLVIDEKLKMKEEEEQKRSYMQRDDSEKFNGFPLISERYSDTQWGAAFASIFSTGNSSESIFELTFNKENQNMLSNSAVNALFGNPEAVVGFAKPADFIAEDGKDNSAYKLFTNKYDTRAYEFRNNQGSLTGVAKFVLRGQTVSTANTEPELASRGVMYAKDKNKSNWIIYRLTDIMLLKAEALVEMMIPGAEVDLSDEQKAYNESLLQRSFSLVNAINKRSICQNTLKDTLVYSDYNSKALMGDLVMLERQRELMFEGKRWYDLVRRSQRDGNTDVLVKLATQKVSDNLSVVQSRLARMDAIYWPYNLDELKVNKNLKQNPAFGSGETGNYEKTN